MILDKYFNFPDMFLEKKDLILLEQTEFNQHIIKLESNK